MLNPKEVIALKLSDYSVPKELRLKYAEMLVSRAVRFYIENHLDSSVVEEDLIPFCKTCGDEISSDFRHVQEEETDHKAKVEYCNLDYSIEHEEKYQKDIIGYNEPKK